MPKKKPIAASEYKKIAQKLSREIRYGRENNKTYADFDYEDIEAMLRFYRANAVPESKEDKKKQLLRENNFSYYYPRQIWYSVKSMKVISSLFVEKRDIKSLKKSILEPNPRKGFKLYFIEDMSIAGKLELIGEVASLV